MAFGLDHYLARAGEYMAGDAQAKQALRDDIKAHLELGQVIGVALLVVSATVLVFALMAGGFFGTLFAIPAVLGAIFGYDTMIACQQGIPLSQNAANFNLAGDELQQFRAIRRSVLTPMFANTLVTGSLTNYAFAQIELDMQRRHH